MWEKKFYEGESRQASSPARPVSEVLAELKGAEDGKRSYREESLRIHGLICAKCGREFDHRNKHLLTVHHKDGNWKNNPRDGSNWETSAFIDMTTSTRGACNWLAGQDPAQGKP